MVRVGTSKDKMHNKPQWLRCFRSLSRWALNGRKKEKDGPEVDSASNRKECHKYFMGDKSSTCIGLTNLPLSCADYQNNWQPQPHRTLRACQSLHRDHFTFTFAIFVRGEKRPLCHNFSFSLKISNNQVSIM
jgi:hypothetical protein